MDDVELVVIVEVVVEYCLGVMCVNGVCYVYLLVVVWVECFMVLWFVFIGDVVVGMYFVMVYGYNFGFYGIEVLV